MTVQTFYIPRQSQRLGHLALTGAIEYGSIIQNNLVSLFEGSHIFDT